MKLAVGIYNKTAILDFSLVKLIKCQFCNLLMQQPSQFCCMLQ